MSVEHLPFVKASIQVRCLNNRDSSICIKLHITHPFSSSPLKRLVRVSGWPETQISTDDRKQSMNEDSSLFLKKSVLSVFAV